jgi:hypothetical protein
MTKFNLKDVWDALHTPKFATDTFNAVLSDFISRVEAYCRQERDLSQRIRTLRFARIALASAKTGLAVGAEKK